MNWGSRNLSDGREQARIPYICNTPEGWDEFIKGTLLLAPTHSLNLWDKGKGWNVRCPWMERLSALLASLRWWTFYRSFQSQTSQSSKLSSSLSIHNPIPNWTRALSPSSSWVRAGYRRAAYPLGRGVVGFFSLRPPPPLTNCFFSPCQNESRARWKEE